MFSKTHNFGTLGQFCFSRSSRQMRENTVRKCGGPRFGTSAFWQCAFSPYTAICQTTCFWSMHCVFCLIFRMFKLSLFHDTKKKRSPNQPHCDRNGSPRGGPFWFVDETESSRPASQPPFMFPRSVHGFTVSAPHGTRVMSHLSAWFVWMSRPALSHFASSRRFAS